MKRPSGSMAVVLVALFVALGGTSIAASRYLITNANQISPHATYQLAVALSHKLRAQAGEQGMPGAEGHKGEQGVTGTTRVVFEGSVGPQGKTGATGAEGPKGPEGFASSNLIPITHVCLSIHDLSVRFPSPTETTDQKEDREARQADYAYIWHVGCAEVHTP